MLFLNVVTTKQPSDAEFDKICTFLPFGEAEKSRVLSIKNKSRKYESLTCLLALNDILKKAEIPPFNILRTSLGKPYCDGEKAPFFSFSHSEGVCAVILSDTAEVGIDIEYINNKRKFSTLAKRFFNEEEKHIFDVSTDTAKTFYEIWTKKEALSKLDGQGLSSLLSGNKQEHAVTATKSVSINERQFIIGIASYENTENIISYSEEII